jgi:Ca2+-binding RTX toxin-like protein
MLDRGASPRSQGARANCPTAVFGKFARPNRTRHAAFERAVAAAIETLEARRLLVVTGQLVADPQHPGEQILEIRGDIAGLVEDIGVTPTLSSAVVAVTNFNVAIPGSPFLGNISSIDIDVRGNNDRVQIFGAQVDQPPRGIVIAGGDGSDVLIGNDGNETFIGGLGDDFMKGEKGADTYQFEDQALPEIDVVAEQDVAEYGVDTLDFKTFNVTQVVTVDLELDYADLPAPDSPLATHAGRKIYNREPNVFPALGGGTALGLENILGGTVNDDLKGNHNVNLIEGYDGNDVMDGRENDDIYLFRPTANNQTDEITEAAGQGTDVLDFSTLLAGNNLDLDLEKAAPAMNMGTHTNRTLKSTTPDQLENVNGGAGNDTIKGNAAGNMLRGNLGNDSLVGRNGGDTLFGDTHNLSAVPSAGGNDALEGDVGDDQLYGEAGNDTMTGGAGDNTWLFFPVNGNETDVVACDDGTGTNTLDFTGVGDDKTVNLGNDTPNNLASHTNGGSTRTVKTAAAGQAANIANVLADGGKDNITGNSRPNTISSGQGDDILDGAGGNDVLSSGPDNDILTSGEGSDTLSGGTGDDTYRFGPAQADQTDTIVESDLAALSKDELDFSTLLATDPVTVNLSLSTSLATHTHRVVNSANPARTPNVRIEKVIGGAGNDNIIGSDDPNTLLGGPGNDILTGGADADTLVGEAGNDALNGLGANDRLEGGADHDNLSGGEGDDMLVGSSGNDTYVFATAGANQTDTIDEADNADSDTVDFFFVGALDPVTINLAQDNSVATHTNRTINVIGAGVGVRIENANGGPANDTIGGNSAANSLRGGAGNDSISGLDQNDYLLGGPGNDTLRGQSGDDTYAFEPLFAAGDQDTVSEQPAQGTDVLDFSMLAASDPVGVSLSPPVILPIVAAHTNRIVFTPVGEAANLENVIGGAGDDSFTGNASNNVISGGPGDDTYFFGTPVLANQDTVMELPNEGTDLLDFTALPATEPLTVDLADANNLASHTSQTVKAGAGQAGNFENVFGGAGNDTIAGNDVANRLEGRAGNDLLDGRLGNDQLLGGQGNDTYRFGSLASKRRRLRAPETDTITELANEGKDTLDFALLPAPEPVTVNLTTDNGMATHGARTINAAAGSAVNIEDVLGGAGNDDLKGNNAVNTFEGFGGNDTMSGGAGAPAGDGSDVYRYVGNANKGSDRIVEVGGFVNFDVIQFSNTPAITLDLGTVALQNNVLAGGLLSITLSSTTGIEHATSDVMPANLTLTGNGFSLGGTPWTVAGPVQITGGQVEGIPNQPVAGAVRAIAVHPTDPNTAYIGTVNGGVWKTTNLLAANPVYTPLTDGLPLSIGAIDIDPANPNVIVAGIGRWSAGGYFDNTLTLQRFGGRLTGLIRTTDAGASWQSLGAATLANRSISAVIVRGNKILAAATNSFLTTAGAGGLWISTDGGATFAPAAGGLPAGDVGDLVADPSDATNSRFYAAVINSGIYRTDNTGGLWNNLTDAAIAAVVGANTNNMKLALHNNAGAGTNAVYLGVVNNGQLARVFRSANQGGTWASLAPPTTSVSQAITAAGRLAPPPQNFVVYTSAGHNLNGGDVVTVVGVTGTNANGTFPVAIVDANRFVRNDGLGADAGAYAVGPGSTWTKTDGLEPREKPGSQGANHFSIAADPLDPNIFYMGGDRQPFPFSNGATNFTGRLFRGNATTGNYTSLTHNNAAGVSAPHADSRDIAPLIDPADNTKTILIETDDGGVYRRTDATSDAGGWFSSNGNLNLVEFYSVDYDSVGNLLLGGTQDVGNIEQSATGSSNWVTVSQGDGTVVNIDDSGVNSIRVSSAPQLSIPFGPRVRTRSAANAVVGADANAPLVVAGGAPATIFNTDVNAAGASLIPFVAPWVMNNRSPTRWLIGTYTSVWESTDGGATVTQTNFGAPAAGTAVSALAYGGQRNSANNLNVAYVGFHNGSIRVRTGAGNAVANFPLRSPAGAVGEIRDIVIDPDDWMIAYAITPTQVFQTFDAGVNWGNITGNLATLVPGGAPGAPGVPALHSITLVSKGPARLLIAAGLGGYFDMPVGAAIPNAGAAAPTDAKWRNFGSAFPKELLVRDTRYDAADDLLSIGTVGRGAYTIPSISTLLNPTVANVQFDNAAFAAEFRTFTPTAVNSLPIGNASGLFAPVGTGNLQLNTYPWSGIDRITIRFSKNVSVNLNSLTLDGVGIGAYGLAESTVANPNPSYDAATFTATWRLASPIERDRLTLTLQTDGDSAIRANAAGQAGHGAILDGDWYNPTAKNNNPSSRFVSGDGLPGGNFVFNFNFLVGDANGDSTVDNTDVALVRNLVGKGFGDAAYDPRADINGNGFITVADVNQVRRNLTITLPRPLPGSDTRISSGHDVIVFSQPSPAGSTFGGFTGKSIFDDVLGEPEVVT